MCCAFAYLYKTRFYLNEKDVPLGIKCGSVFLKLILTVKHLKYIKYI